MKNVLSRVGAIAGFLAIWMGAYVVLMPNAFSGSIIEAKAAVAQKTLPEQKINPPKAPAAPKMVVVHYERISDEEVKKAGSM